MTPPALEEQLAEAARLVPRRSESAELRWNTRQELSSVSDSMCASHPASSIAHLTDSSHLSRYSDTGTLTPHVSASPRMSTAISICGTPHAVPTGAVLAVTAAACAC